MASFYLSTTVLEGNFVRIYYNESYIFLLFPMGNEKMSLQMLYPHCL